MRSILFSLLLVTASSAQASSHGIVESVREVQRAHPASGVLEHAVRPQADAELVIRLDDGREVRVVEGGLQALEPGTRVLVLGKTAVRLSSP